MSAMLCVNVHFIWSTARRDPSIRPEWQANLHAYFAGISENISARLLIAGGVADHVHVYASLPAKLSIADFVNKMKSSSSRWIHENHDRTFAWQTKYAAFSVSKSAEDAVCAYIRNQEEHHRRRTFREELLEFLERHQVEYDPQYFLE